MLLEVGDATTALRFASPSSNVERQVRLEVPVTRYSQMEPGLCKFRVLEQLAARQEKVGWICIEAPSETHRTPVWTFP